MQLEVLSLLPSVPLSFSPPMSSFPLFLSTIQFHSLSHIRHLLNFKGILNLGGNPVGIAGGTSLMETLNYYICDRWVMLHGCTYPSDNQESTSRCNKKWKCYASNSLRQRRVYHHPECHDLHLINLLIFSSFYLL